MVNMVLQELVNRIEVEYWRREKAFNGQRNCRRTTLIERSKREKALLHKLTDVVAVQAQEIVLMRPLSKDHVHKHSLQNSVARHVA